MSKLLSLEDGIVLTHFARKTIESYLHEKKESALPESTSEALLEHRGVFVTLKKRRSSTEDEWLLRGCIGHLQLGPNSRLKPTSLLEATRQVALSSALQDPRFPPVKAEELESILVEISVLTMPEDITIGDRSKLSDHIQIGKDGLIIEGKGWHRGLLLPQVAPEQSWNTEEFLQGCCQKAGLPPDCYLDTDVTIMKFQAQIFAETSPNGEVVELQF